MCRNGGAAFVQCRACRQHLAPLKGENMQTTKWPTRETAKYERVVDRISIGGRPADPSKPDLDTVAIERQLAAARPGATIPSCGADGTRLAGHARGFVASTCR